MGIDLGTSRVVARKINQEVDTANRTFTTTWADGKVWEQHRYKAGSKLLLNIYIPCENDTTGWGGGYLEIQYNINNSGWQSLGHSGYTMAMAYPARLVDAYNNTILFDPDQTNDFDLQFKFRHRSYGNTLEVNVGTDFSGDSFATHLIIEEILKS